jgi:hypothetical protein
MAGKKEVKKTRTPKLRNDGSGKPEITEEDIRKMPTDGWTQRELRRIAKEERRLGN